MRRVSVVVAVLLICLLAFGVMTPAALGHGHKGGGKTKTCPPSSHNPGGTPPNCGQAPTEPPPPPTTTVAPACPEVSGDVSGLIIGIAREVGPPAEEILIEVACLIFELTEL